MQYNIVTNYQVNQIFKSKSKYYRMSLGFATTMIDRTGERRLNKADNFAYFYNQLYKATIQAQGSIGNIRFYTDHYIKEDHIAFYYDEEEFIFDFDKKMVEEKGADFYLGHLIKTIETQHQDRIKEKEVQIEEQKKVVGDPDKIFVNPGAMTYADLKAYMDKKNAERLKS